MPIVRNMTRKARPKRQAPISYRPPEQLRDEFCARVVNSGLSVNGFITASVFNQAAPRARRVAPLDRQIAAQLLSQAARISDRLLASQPLASTAQAALLKECRDELAEIRTCLMHVLGREP